MKINKVNHSLHQYECGQGIARVNIYNGNLLFDYPIMTVGASSYQIDVRLHYNSDYQKTDFNSKKIGFGNGWKLNIQQYLFKYETSYGLEGFNDENYVYIDQNWNIHKFVRYNPVLLTNVYPYYYYDENGSGLRLQVNEDGSCKIIDFYHNSYLFDVNGNLTAIISGVNSNIVKKITYDTNQNVISIYDNRKANRTINFEYNEKQELTKTWISTSKINYNLEYDNNRLIGISKNTNVEENGSITTYTKKELKFIYNDANLMLYSINSLDLTGLKYDYNTEKQVTIVSVGVVKSTIITETVPSCMDVGEDVYVKDNVYPTKEGLQFKAYEITMPEDKIKETILYDYATNYTKVTNDKGISINNYFNIDGTKISELEVENDNEYYSMFKNKGWLLPSSASSEIKLNKESCIELTNNNSFKYSINELKSYIATLELDEEEEEEEEEGEETSTDSDNKKIEHIKVSFWLNMIENNTSNLTINLNCNFSDSNTNKKVKIEKTLDNVWQYVVIPISFNNQLTELSEMTISIEGCSDNTKILITDVRLEYGGAYNLMLFEVENNTYQEYQVDMGSIIVLDNVEKVISPEFYLTENDLLATYKNIYTKETDKPFDFVCCNGTKVYLVNRAYLKVDNQEIDFELDDENICNYYLKLVNLSKKDGWIISEVQTRFHYDSNMGKHYYETKRAIGRLEGDSNYRLNDDNSEIMYEWTNEDGTFRATKNVRKVITEYFYDDYGNIESIEVFKENERYENSVTNIYEYNDTETLNRETPIYCHENGLTIKYEYDNEEGIIKSISKIKINTDENDLTTEELIDKVEYLYDVYNENITSIVFKDSNDQVISINNVDYIKNGKVKKMFDSNNEKYLFNYNKLGDLTKINVNNKYTLETKLSKEENSEIVTEYIYYDEDSKDETLTNKTTYDNYGRLETYANNNQIATFKYEDNPNSTLIARVNEIVDEFSNEVTNIEYLDEGKTQSKTITLKDKLKVTTSSNNSIKYEILDDNELVTYNKTNKDMLSNTLGKTSYSIKNKETSITDNCGVFNYTYEYDDCNRLKSNKSDGIIYEACDENCNCVLVAEDGTRYHPYELPGETSYYFVKNLSYIEGTNLVEKVSCSKKYSYIHTRNGETGYKAHEWINWNYNHEYEKGNIKKITEEGLNDKQTIREYEYDSLNRLTKETTTYQEIDSETNNITNQNQYTYEYSEQTGLLSKITKKETDVINNIENITITKIKETNENLTNEDEYDKIYEVEYDNYGNITKNGNVIMTYNSRNLMDSYSYSTEGIEPINYRFEYYYNHQGVRYQKKKRTDLNGKFPSITYVNYHLNGNTILGEDEVDENGNLLYRFKYFYNMEGICGIRYNGCNFELIKDSIGNVSKIIYDGTIVGEYEYDAWGNCKVTESSYFFENGNYDSYIDTARFVLQSNPFRYKGYYYDVETQLYWVSSRYYSPELCRWISPDSIEYLDPESTNGLNLYAYCGNDPVNRFDPSGHAWEWSSFWQGVGYLVTGIGAIVAGALVIASGVATWPMLLVAGITIGAGALTTINGASEVVEAGTGYNFVEDTVFGGNSSAYNTYATITGSVATVGSIVCGGWYRYNTPRIQAYKNVGNYNFSGTLSDSTHLARPYQHSTLLQRNIIKYGKMVKESSGIYNFTIGGAYKIGWVSYGVGNVGSHPVTWKLVLDIGKQIILHAGF